MSDQAYGRQIPLDGQGGKIGDNPQDDIAHLREGGQTDYGDTYTAGREPFDKVTRRPKPDFETRFLDIDIQPVPVAVQEDRALLVYDFVQKQYNVQLTGGATAITTEIDVVEDGWWWLPDRIGLFGTATGFLTVADGAASDSSEVFATQAGVAALLGGVQTVQGIVMSQRTPLILRAIGVDANAPISIGLWYRKCKWVWTPSKFIADAPAYSGDTDTLPGLSEHNIQSRSTR